MLTVTNPRFPLGEVVITANANSQLQPDHIATALQRHAQGDWGELCDEDMQQNELALEHGCQLFSSYRSGADITFWIITESDRSVTNVEINITELM
jgi:hypothetical protein